MYSFKGFVYYKRVNLLLFFYCSFILQYYTYTILIIKEETIRHMLLLVFVDFLYTYFLYT